MAWVYKKRKVENKIDRRRLGYLIDGRYDKKQGVAKLYFLDPKNSEVFTWLDTSGHKSYLLTDATIPEVEEIIGLDPEYLKCERVLKKDSIRDTHVELTKVYAKTPTAIGGGGKDSYRNLLQTADYNIWEAWIRYKLSYVYDHDLIYGMPYLVSDKKVEPYHSEESKKRVDTVLEAIVNNVDLNKAIFHFVDLFESDIPDLDICALDIEVLPNDKNQVPNPEVALQPVIAVSFVINGKKTIYYLERPDDLEDVKVHIMDATVKKFVSEKSLVGAVMNMIRKHPIIVTFNGDGFDLKYLYNRAKRLGFGKYSIPMWSIDGRQETTIYDHIHLDLYKFFKNKSVQNYAFKGAYQHYGLDDISQALLGRGKIEHEKPIGRLNYQELCEYCLMDSMLTYDLLTLNDNVTLNLMLTISRMSNMPIQDVCRTQISTWSRGTFYFWMRQNNILIPSQEELLIKGSATTSAGIKGKKYEGAIVKEPKSGVFFDVTVVDFASLYPSEMKEQNICFSTINCKHEECKTNKVPYTDHHICTKKTGITPVLIGGLKDMRVYWYKGQAKNHPNPKTRAYYSVFEQAIKVYINASYGVFGSEFFALHCTPVAESITAFGRFHISAISDKAEEMGLDPFYGDTDSIFIHGASEEDIRDLINWAKITHHLDLGIDYKFKYACFSTRKKNYLGIKENGDLVIKGLTGKKSHTPPLIKEAFNKVVKILKTEVDTPSDFDIAKDKICTITKSEYERLALGHFELEELSVTMTLGRPLANYETNPQHVKAARILEENGIHIDEGDVVEFVKATNEEKVMPVKMADKKLVNIKAYQKNFEAVMTQVFDALGIEFEHEIKGIPKQLSLDSLL